MPGTTCLFLPREPENRVDESTCRALNQLPHLELNQTIGNSYLPIQQLFDSRIREASLASCAVFITESGLEGGKKDGKLHPFYTSNGSKPNDEDKYPQQLKHMHSFSFFPECKHGKDLQWPIQPMYNVCSFSVACQSGIM